jgi:hypothetical protein
MFKYKFALLFLIAISAYSQTKTIETGVTFHSSDPVLQKIYDIAYEKSKWNIKDFGKYKVMVEGAIYGNVWLETQPMGGYMYAKHDIAIARNNIEIFMDLQRADGRFPGMIVNNGNDPVPLYGWLQGLYLPTPAFELYFWLGRDKAYLNKLYTCLEKFDAYLWKYRDSDNNGCLETWCIWDNGEDESTRFHDFPNSWPFNYPPNKDSVLKMTSKQLQENCNESTQEGLEYMTVPIESMDFMSYSYSCKDVLYLISLELKNGRADYWKGKSEIVRKKIKDYLWVSDKQACYDYDKDNKRMNTLLHNNLRCMYFGSFDQKMADGFIKSHLLNPKEFWTPMPLPSVAANDPMFRDIAGNNWSGQPQGLTFQRSISALENYGHYAELTLVAEKFLKVIGDSLKFTQQFYPFEAKINNSKDGYGPSILSSMEFITRLYGIHFTKDTILWSCLERGNMNIDYTQKWDALNFKMTTKDNMVLCVVNDKNVLSFSKGVRAVTDLKGNLVEIVGIDPKPQKAKVIYKSKEYILKVKPNQRYRLNSKGSFYLYKQVPFDYVP